MLLPRLQENALSIRDTEKVPRLTIKDEQKQISKTTNGSKHNVTCAVGANSSDGSLAHWRRNSGRRSERAECLIVLLGVGKRSGCRILRRQHRCCLLCNAYSTQAKQVQQAASKAYETTISSAGVKINQLLQYHGSKRKKIPRNGYFITVETPHKNRSNFQVLDSELEGTLWIAENTQQGRDTNMICISRVKLEVTFWHFSR